MTSQDSLQPPSRPKKWLGVDVSHDASDTFKRVLRAEHVGYEPSENGHTIHFQVLTTDEDLSKLLARAGLA